MSISALGSSTAATTAATTATTSTSTAQSSVAKTSTGTVASAVSLAGDASVVATIGAGGTSTTTYSAAGLLNSIVDAGAAPSVTVPSIGTDTSQVAQLANDAGVVDTLSTSASGSGEYSANSTLKNLSAAHAGQRRALAALQPGRRSILPPVSAPVVQLVVDSRPLAWHQAPGSRSSADDCHHHQRRPVGSGLAGRGAKRLLELSVVVRGGDDGRGERRSAYWLLASSSAVISSSMLCSTVW